MRIRQLKVIFIFLSTLLAATALQATPLDRADVPQPLQPWVEWALHGETRLDCPWYYDKDQRACTWPAQLNLQLDENGGSFSQQWQVFSESYVRLPGDSTNWPQDISNGSDPLLVEKRNGFPTVKLTPGSHNITGKFRWSRLPKALRVTPQSGLIRLSVNDKTIERPDINPQGQLWLTQGKTEAVSEDNLDIQVFRKVTDSHPILVETMLKLRVSGKQRNTLLAPVLLADFIPLRIDSPLPARLTDQRQLQVQLRPGEWTLQLTGRALADKTAFALPASESPWPEQEVWVLQTDNAMRQTEVAGVNSIDPNQTRLPPEWKTLPAYLLTPGQSLNLEVIQRGAAQTGKQNLNLKRDMWLDFAGKGYTFKDQLHGNIRQQSRLNVLPEVELGRVSVDGQPQFITRHDESSPSGVELRRSQLNLSAESRYTGTISAPPVNGWQHDMQRVNTRLHLPPGWRLFAANGTDNQPQSWIQNWSLLDLFLVLVIAIGTAYLFGWLWGVLALFALVFTWHESGAPQFIWLNILAATALFRVLPGGWLRRSVNTYRWISLLVLAVIVLPYLINTVRVGLYPQLTYNHHSGPGLSGQMSMGFSGESEEQMMVADEAVMETAVQQAPVSTSSRISKDLANNLSGSAMKMAPEPAAPRMKKSKYDMKAIDPNSMIQTGPGLPSWQNYRAINLHWAGPVKADERASLILITPQQNLLLKLLGMLLILLLSWRMLSQSRGFSWPPDRWFGGSGEDATTAVKHATQAGIKAGTEPATRQPAGNGKKRSGGKTLALFILTGILFAGSGSLQTIQAESGIPNQQMLEELRERLTAAPDCLPDCAQIERMDIVLGGNTLSARLKVHAGIATAIPLPGSQDTWLADDIRLNYQTANALQRDQQQQLWLMLPAGQHDIQLRGVLPRRNTIALPLPLKPHQVSWQSLDKQWTLDGIRDSGSPESQLRLNRVLNEDEKAQQKQEQSILPTFVKIERHLHLGLDWHVETTVHRLAPLNMPISLSIPLLPNEQPMSEQLQISKQQVKINLGAQQMQTSWSSRLTPGQQIVLQAANNPDYLESWHLATSPVWHVASDGLAANRFTQQDGQRVPVWLPWPGETLTLDISRPQGVPGQTVTILASKLRVQAGKRANDIKLDMNIRSSRGVQHMIELPADADLQALNIDGIAQRIQRNDKQLALSLKPGLQAVSIQWRENQPLGLRYQFPPVKPGLDSVNTRLQINPPRDRWILWAQGPALGPAVLFWGVLLALLIVSLALGYSGLTPVKSWQWFLLGIGLSQTEPMLMIVVAGWLLAIALRSKMTLHLKWWQFNLIQLALAGLTAVALLILAVALSHGLLGQPEMQIAGNGSSAYNLNWYQDRSGGTLPQPSLISVPLWVYRALMLAWALWLAIAVLRWLGWGWQALNKGQLWMPKPPRKPKAVVDAES